MTAPNIQQLTVTPLETSAGFGAEITGVDLITLDDATFKQLEAALYKYKLLVIKNQPNLLPDKQLELCIRFDPESSGGHGHGGAKEVLQRKIKGKQPITGGTPSLPENDKIRVIGYGTFEEGHYGMSEVTMSGLSHVGFHKTPMSKEEMEKGNTRWHRWHIDAQFFKEHPARVTTLWAHTLPSGPDLTVQYDDGTGQTCQAPVGKTAFLDAAALYRSLTPEQQAFCANTVVEYPPHPYSWIVDCGAESNGFGLISEDKELSFKDLPPYDPKDIQVLPLLWKNPVTGELAMQCHAVLAYKLHTTVDGKTTTVDDLREVRKILNDLQRPFLKQENIVFSSQQEGDLALWYNRGLRHSAVEYPLSVYGRRLAHQCHIVGSDSPANPAPIPGLTVVA